ncbi:MAG: WhiB family transcriptional regulator [Actinomycetota bacterium]|jgi:WhiB family redox-sensing transcriptional regulator|nr:WhiB family transcriptional regulator [Actinomycetota bacterium]
MESAACKGMDPAIFHPAHRDLAAGARAVCHSCPVKKECLERALDYNERQGIRGGLTPLQRRRFSKCRIEEATRISAQKADEATACRTRVIEPARCKREHDPSRMKVYPYGIRVCLECHNDTQKTQYRRVKAELDSSA